MRTELQYILIRKMYFRQKDMLLLLSNVHRHLLKGMTYTLAHLNGCWSFNSLLTGVLFPGNENALPGSKNTIITRSLYYA